MGYYKSIQYIPKEMDNLFTASGDGLKHTEPRYAGRWANNAFAVSVVGITTILFKATSPFQTRAVHRVANA